MDLLPARKSLDHPNADLLDLFKDVVAEADSYVQLFESRVKIEEDYIDNLRRLALRQREHDFKIDAKVNRGDDLPGLRKAWREMRENMEREAETRGHFIHSLKETVIAPLASFRDTQERTRKRVKEDLRISALGYTEMRNTTLPRLYRTYWRRCEDYEQLREQIRLQSEAVEAQQRLLSSSNAAHSNWSSTAPVSPQQHAQAGTTSMTRSKSAGIADSATSPGKGTPGAERPVSAGLNQVPRASSTQPSCSADTYLQQLQQQGEAPAPTDLQGAVGTGVPVFPSPAATQSTGVPGSSGLPSPAAVHGVPPPIPPRRTEVPPTTPTGAGPASGTGGREMLHALKTRDFSVPQQKLNAFIGRFRDGGGDKHGGEKGGGAGMGKEGGGGSVATNLSSSSSIKANTQALKGVKAKREAEEADKAYREGVFKLETLRLRREKTYEAAYKSVVELRCELTSTAQRLFAECARMAESNSATQQKLFEHVEDVLQKVVNHEVENQRFAATLPREDAVAEETVLYNNYYVGPCKNLIFGVSLNDYAFNRGSGSRPPLIVTKCIEYVDARGLTAEGIYRISAKHSSLENLVRVIEKDEETFQFDPKDVDVWTVAGVLKYYLRQLPVPVFAFPIEDRLAVEPSERLAVLKGKIRRLPAVNHTTLMAIVEHLTRVAAQEGENKMSVTNISLVFAPVIFGEDTETPLEVQMKASKDATFEDLLNNAAAIFDTPASAQSSQSPAAKAASISSGVSADKATKTVASSTFSSAAPSSVTSSAHASETPFAAPLETAANEGGAVRQGSSETPTPVPANASADTSADASADAPADTLADTSADAPADASAPADAPAPASASASEPVPGPEASSMPVSAPARRPSGEISA